MESEKFQNRHIGINECDEKLMLDKIGVSSLDELINQTIPSDIRIEERLNIPKAISEHEYAEEITPEI